jgi:hypothetical protein
MKILKNSFNTACLLVFPDDSDVGDVYAGGDSDVSDAELDLDDEENKKKLLDESVVDLPLD